jgi:Protein of unknown function (DUF3619)
MTNSLQYQSELSQDRFGLKAAYRLSESTSALPYDITERLRASRMQALSKRKLAVARKSGVVLGQGGEAVLGMGDEGWDLWSRIGSVLPLVALILGLVAINLVQNDNRASELAEVDAALLTDDLPPAAYSDPGFLQFLRSEKEQPR